jgi:hypothetical protein
MRETIQHYTQTQIKVNEHFVVRKDHMDVKVHERPSNITYDPFLLQAVHLL